MPVKVCKQCDVEYDEDRTQQGIKLVVKCGTLLSIRSRLFFREGLPQYEHGPEICDSIHSNFIRKTMPYDAWLLLVPGLRAAEASGLFGEWTGVFDKSGMRRKNVVSPD